MKIYIFYFEDDDSFSFKVKSDNAIDAYNKAYKAYGPQVEDMMYKEIK